MIEIEKGASAAEANALLVVLNDGMGVFWRFETDAVGTTVLGSRLAGDDAGAAMALRRYAEGVLAGLRHVATPPTVDVRGRCHAYQLCRLDDADHLTKALAGRFRTVPGLSFVCLKEPADGQEDGWYRVLMLSEDLLDPTYIDAVCLFVDGYLAAG